MLQFENKDEFKALVNEIIEENPTIRRLANKVDKIDTRLDAHDEKFVSLDARFDRVDKKFVAMDEKFTDLFRYQTILMEEMNRKIDTLYDIAIDTRTIKLDLSFLEKTQERLGVHSDIIEQVLARHIQDKSIHVPTIT